MLKYIVKRLIYMIPTLIGVTLIVFLIVSLMPGDPAKMILGDNAPPEAILELREELGLNKPLHIRYLDYMSDLLRGDMGESFATGKSVSEEIASRFPVTAELALFSILFSVGIGIPVGVVSAVKQYSLLDSVTVILTLLFASVPTFWLGLMLMLVFGLRLEWFPTSGINEGIRSYILPALSMATISLSMIARMTRSTMLEAIRQDYIRTARAKGATERIVVWHHAIKNALIPVITVAGTEIGFLLGGAVAIESIFALPGLGTFLVDAVKRQDIPVIMGTVIYMAAIFAVVNLVVDIIYSFVDPRIKSEYTK